MDNLAVKDPIILRDSILESTILTVTQIDQLTDILYNHFYKKRPNYGISSCFYPRNAILFFDANGNLKESILICFQCDQYALSSTSINIGDDCDQKLTLLKAFFSKSGIYFGTSDNPLFYPGEKYKDEGITISEK